MEVLIKATLSDDSTNNYLLPLDSSIEEEVKSPEEIVVDETELATEETVIEPETSRAEHLSLEDAVASPLFDQQELDELKESAKEEGYRDGYNEGVLEVQTKYNAQLETFDSLLIALDEVVPLYLEESEPVIAAIVFESVRKVIGDALADRAKSLEIVKNTIRDLDQKSIREVLINQSDFDALEALKKDLSTENELLDAANQFEFKVDQTIHYGGCKVKLIEGYLNATIDGQLTALSKSLIEKAEALAK